MDFRLVFIIAIFSISTIWCCRWRMSPDRRNIYVLLPRPQQGNIGKTHYWGIISKIFHLFIIHFHFSFIQLSSHTGCFYKLSPINLVWGQLKCTKSNFNPVHVFLHFKSFGLVVLQLILASKLSEWEQLKNFAAIKQ